jgi:hypothetical protein
MIEFPSVLRNPIQEDRNNEFYIYATWSCQRVSGADNALEHEGIMSPITVGYRNTAHTIQAELV